VPESFKVLIKELQSLGLNVVPMGAVVEDPVEEVKRGSKVRRGQGRSKKILKSLLRQQTWLRKKIFQKISKLAEDIVRADSGGITK